MQNDLILLFQAGEDEVRRTLDTAATDDMIAAAGRVTLDGFGGLVTYSRKVFIPLTRLCRDVCHYCTFATTPGHLDAPFLSIEEVLAIARAGKEAGCREALFTLGDAPELRYDAARRALKALGHETTLSYLATTARAVLDETGLLPHLNPGLMSSADYAALRPVSASMGVMLETSAARLCEPGGPHYGSPDKFPAVRLATIEAAGEARVPFTTGLLIGIGETRAERIDALLAIRALHQQYGHIQEVIIQNFLPKPGTKMAAMPGAGLDDHLWTIAAARLILGPSMTIQAPPNLHEMSALPALLDAGVNDWGGVSPVTPDHVNPEAPWPHLDTLAAATMATGRHLRERLAIGPAFAQRPDHWMAPAIATRVRRQVDGRGLPIIDGWHPGTTMVMPVVLPEGRTLASTGIEVILTRATAGDRLSESDIVRLFEAEGADVTRIAAAADRLRGRAVGDTVSYVVNRNIRQGGVLPTTPQPYTTFNPEKLDAYEVGFKSSIRGAIKGTFNVSAFYNDFRNEQTLASFGPIVPGTVPSSSGILNADKSRTYGVEVDASLTPFPGLTVSGSYAYLNTKIKRIPPVFVDPRTGYTATSAAQSGDQELYSPKNKYTVTASYTLPLDASIGKIDLNATFSHSDSQLANYSNRTAGRVNGLSTLAGRDLIDLNLNWNSVAGLPVDAQFFVTNLTKEKYYTVKAGTYGFLGYDFAAIGAPRMFGGRLKYHFGG